MKVFILMALSFFIIMGCDNPKNWPMAEFDQSSWLRSTENERYRWAQDIIDRHLLDGLTRNQVIDLLGAPSSQNLESIAYIVKTGGSGFNQIYILDIRFKKYNNIVESYRIRGD